MLADKGPCIGGFYWDVNAITLFAFKEMKHLPIFPALLRETLTSLYCLYCRTHLDREQIFIHRKGPF